MSVHIKIPFSGEKRCSLARGVSNGLNTWDPDVGQPVCLSVAPAGNQESFKSVN